MVNQSESNLFLKKLENVQESHFNRKGRKLYFYVLGEARWGHDLTEYMCAIKHASDNDYDVAFICTDSRNRRRLSHLSIKNISVCVEFLNLIDLANGCFTTKQLKSLKSTWIQDSAQLEDWNKNSSASSKFYSDNYFWPYSTPLRLIVHSGSLCHPYFYYWRMNRKRYDSIVSNCASNADIDIIDNIMPNDIEDAHKTYPIFDSIREDFHRKDRVVIGINVRGLGAGKGRRDSSIITLNNIFSILEKRDEIKRAHIVFFGSRIELREKFISKFTKIKFSLIPSYNEKWNAIDRNVKANNSFHQRFITIEQLLIRYSNIVIMPDSGAGLLPVTLGKISIMCDSYSQTSPFSNILYLATGMISQSELSSSEMLNYAVKNGISNPDVNSGNSLIQLFNALCLACMADEDTSGVKIFSKFAKHDSNIISADLDHFNKFLNQTEFSRGLELIKPRFQVERNGQLIYY